MKEIWKDIKGYEKIYQISNLGRVKRLSYWHKVGLKNVSITYRTERILKQSCDSNGYKQVCLTKNSKKKSHSIHKIMAIVFIPNSENKKQVNHINGIKTDNNIENLEWCTYHENLKHAMKNGLRATGERHGATNLLNKDVIKIRELFEAKKYSIKELAKKYNIAYSTMHQIINKKYWKTI